MTYDEMIAVIQAAKDGKQIQKRPIGTKFEFEDCVPYWNFASFDYRAKPEPRRVWVRFYPGGRSYSALPEEGYTEFVEVVK